jgi:hypothetical protein
MAELKINEVQGRWVDHTLANHSISFWRPLLASLLLF